MVSKIELLDKFDKLRDLLSNEEHPHNKLIDHVEGCQVSYDSTLKSIENLIMIYNEKPQEEA